MTDVLTETADPLFIERCSDSGELLGVVRLDAEYFGVLINVPLLHQVVNAQRAARRAGTHSTLTRAEVAGGGAKPYRQKGTGRARQGTTRAPHYAGGGVAFGPKPRDYSQRTPRKMVRQALRAALSDRAVEGRVCLVDQWSYEVPKTKRALASMRALGLEGRVLLVVGQDDVVAERSFANIPEVSIIEAAQLTAYDVVVSDWVVFTDETMPGTLSDAPAGTTAYSSARPVPGAGNTVPEPAADEDEPADEDETADEDGAADEDETAGERPEAVEDEDEASEDEALQDEAVEQEAADEEDEK